MSKFTIEPTQKKPKRPSNFAMISVRLDCKDLLDEMRKAAVLSYSDVIFYLLAKAHHLEPVGDDLKRYNAIDEFINGV